MKIAVTLVGLLCILGSLFAVATINSCTILNGTVDKVYVLNSDVVGAPFVVPNPNGGANNVCMYINASDITLDCEGHSITSNNPMNYIGIYTDIGLNNITVKNCKISDYISGISSGATDSEFSFNTLINNGNGIFQHGGSGNYFSFNNATSNTKSTNGYFLTASNNNRLENNTANGGAIGFKLDSANSNTLSMNTADGPNIGFFVFSVSKNNLLTHNIALNCNEEGILSQTAFSSNTYDSNLAGGCTDGFRVTGNTATFINNRAELNTNNGFVIASSNNLIRNNSAINNGNNGFRIESNANNDANNNIFESNFASKNRFDGFQANGGIGNKYIKNTANQNGEDGMDVAGDNKLELTENHLELNGGEGVDLAGSEPAKLSKNTFIGNKNAGLYVWGSVTVDGDSHSEQKVDLIVNNTRGFSIKLNLNNAEFNGDGKTILTIDDEVEPNSAYEISQVQIPKDVPEPYRAFSKIDLTNKSGIVKIDQISWGWDQSNLNGFNPSQFELWNYHSGSWSKLDTTSENGHLTIHDLDTFSSFAIVVPPKTSGGNGKSLPSIKYETSLSCKNNSINVTSNSNGNALSDARTAIDFGSQVRIVQTDEKGMAYFDGCGQQVKISISKEGYLPTDFKIQLADCTCKIIVPETPQCTSNNQCSETNSCVNNKCTQIICNGGKIENHVCIIPPKPECSADSDCSISATCSLNKCVQIECKEGSVVNHKCVAQSKNNTNVTIQQINQTNTIVEPVPTPVIEKPAPKLDSFWLIGLAIFLICGGFAVYWVSMRRK